MFSFVLAGILSVYAGNVTVPADPGKPAAVAAPNSLNKTLMLKLVNQVRSKGCQCGPTWYPPAPALLWSDQLEEAATLHSKDMYKKSYLAHTAPDGSNGGERIERTGYHWKSFGENIAEGYTSESEVLEGWLKSPGHCKNILSRTYKEMGVARTGDYWTQMFASK
ncbi:CAP domain-containing protein [Paraflavisolibacter sp. H34]|uniref:CAP domain-containing protein n=1 Tax=Huijunlia imazamoxiresistens TaxID=3127457 RepID=UPI00301A51EC